MDNPRILIFDIETSPNVSYNWRTYEQNAIDFVRPWSMLCFAYKWYGEKTVRAEANWDYGKTIDDLEITIALWALFDEADIIIAHNGDKFDIKMVNTRFLFHGLGAPSPYKTIDTKKIASRYFSMPRNSLDYIGEYLGLGRKVKHEGWEMWEGCIEGVVKWQQKMVRYNKQDVALLEKIWLAMQSFESNGPNMAALSGLNVCPKCGADSKHLQSRGFTTPAIWTYRQFWCTLCKSWPRGTHKVQRPLTNYTNQTRR